MVKKLTSVLLLILFAFGISFSSITRAVPQQAPPTPDPTKELTIVYTHDIHSHLYSRWTGTEAQGGIALLASLVKQLETIRPTLVLDCGDIISGGAVNDLNDGLPMIEVMNAIGYDAVALDNHEFDQGVPKLKGMISAANFDMVSATAHWPGSPQAPDYTIVEFAGLQIGIIGLTHSFWYAPNEVTFTDIETSAINAATELESLGVNFTIALGCIGSGSAETIAQNAPGLDLVVKSYGPQKVESTLIVPSVSSYCQGVGILNITIDVSNGTVLNYSFSSRSLTTPLLQPDPVILGIIDGWNAPIASMLDAPVGYTYTTLDSGDLGYLLAESIWQNTSADAGIYNHGGVRDSIDEGFITLRDIYHVEPFLNFVATVTIPGWLADSVVPSNHHATSIIDFVDSTFYTIASSNFTITSLERNYGSDVTNRQNYFDRFVVAVLANHLASEYPITTTECRDGLTKAHSTVDSLPNTDFTGGSPTTLRNSILTSLSDAIDALDLNDAPTVVTHVETARNLIEQHINASAPQRWLNTTLSCVIQMLDVPPPTTPTTPPTTPTTPPTTPTTPPILPIPGYPWLTTAFTIILTLTFAVIVRKRMKYSKKGKQHN